MHVAIDQDSDVRQHQADCHEMTMSIDCEPIGAFFDGATPSLDIRRASGDKYGKFFIGLGRDAEGVPASEARGSQVAWDQNGWVKG